MYLYQIIKRSKYHLLLSVIPLIIIAGGLKFLFHILEWEIIPTGLTSFFPSILTGIIFILGFLLAGVVTDYKESEKIPNEIASSLFSIWQEVYYIKSLTNSETAQNMINKIKTFVPVLKTEFFIKRNEKIKQLIHSFSEDITELGKQGIASNYIVRIKTEQANLVKIINRIDIIKNTDFIPSVFVCIRAITIVFLLFYCLLKVEPWWGGILLVCIFTFVIFALLFLIKDMEDPFEYDGSEEQKSDEISLKVLDNLHEGFNKEIL